jgi:hypothetical protein
VSRLELKSPFVYLHQLAGGDGGKQVKRKSSRRAGKQTSSPDGTGCSFQISFCDHTPTQNEQTALSLASDFMEYLELTRYPQRLTLEQLLIDEQ